MSACNHTRDNISDSLSRNHSYRPNPTPLSPITIINYHYHHLLHRYNHSTFSIIKETNNGKKNLKTSPAAYVFFKGQDEGVLPSTKPTGRMRIPATNPPTAAAHVACVLDDVQDAAIQIKIGACKIKDNIWTEN